MIIDFHTHIFPEKIAERTITTLAEKSRAMAYTNGTAEELSASMKEAGISYSVNLPVMTNVLQDEKVNRAMTKGAEEYRKMGILVFGGVHPLDPDYREVIDTLAAHHIPGIKIHPAYQNTDIEDIKMKRIISYASEKGLIVVTHAGWDIGFPNHNYCTVAGLLEVIKEVAPPKFVLAHMGGWNDWKTVERDLAGAPVYFDTAFSLGPVRKNPASSCPPVPEENLREEDFVRLVRKHGADKILFGTDSPWSDQKEMTERIKSSSLTKQEQEMIFAGNAKKLIGGVIPFTA